MSNGVLGKAMSVANNPVTVYTIPNEAEFATITIHCLNMGTGNATVKVALTTSPSAGPADYIEHLAVIPANGGILERNCILAGPGEKVIIEADNANVAIRISGLVKIVPVV